MKGIIRGVFASLAVGWSVDALLLSKPRKEKVRVIGFGDSFIGWPGWPMLERMFMRHGVDAKVKHLWWSQTRSCAWALMKEDAVHAIKRRFRHYVRFGRKVQEVPDYMWFSLGVNDFDNREYTDCSSKAQNYKAQKECMKIVRSHSTPCIATLLERFWQEWPDMKIYQNNYELPTWNGVCYLTNTRFPFCRTNVTCIQKLMRDYALETVAVSMDRWGHTGKYDHFYIAGTLQAAMAYPNTSPGHPDITKGSPADLLADCGHINPVSLGGWMIGEVLWNKYWSKEVVPTLTPVHIPRPNSDHKIQAPDPGEWKGPAEEAREEREEREHEEREEREGRGEGTG